MAKLLPAIVAIVVVVVLSAGYLVLSGNLGGGQTSSSTSSQTTTSSQTSSSTSSQTTTSSQTSSSTSSQTTAEYLVAEYVPGEYSGVKSPLIFGEIDYAVRYDYSLSGFTPPFRVRLWEETEGLTYNTGVVSTIGDYDYAEWNFGTGQAYISKTGTQQARLYNDSNGSFVDSGFGWLGSRWCQGKLFIDTESEVIVNAAEEALEASDTPYQTAKYLALWVLDRVSYSGDDVVFSKTPTQTLASGEGQCIELSMLYASLCRAAGIPARLVSGEYFSKKDKVGGHYWAEFYDSGDWIPVDLTLMLRYHVGPTALDFGPASDWFGFADGRDVTRYIEDASENSMERLYSDTYEFDSGLGLHYGITYARTGSMSIQMGARLLVYNTGRRELFIDFKIPT